MFAKLRLFLMLLLLLPLSAQAALEVRITQGVEGAVPLAIVPFGGEGGSELAAVIRANLERSGRFEGLDAEAMPQQPQAADQVEFARWQETDREYLVVGGIRASGSGQVAVRFQLLDVASGRQLVGYSIPATPDTLRRAAHMVSDLIYERLTGQRGAFDTQVAYISVTREGGQLRYALQVADADGHNPQVVFRSSEPIMSPAWSPDARRLAYVSFENGQSEIFIQNLATGERQRVAAHEGINSAPAFSPDGRQLALTLSRDGQPDIYVMNLADQSLTRLTNNRSIDTEPAWMPDGRSIVFTSDRVGRPQLYEVPARGGNAQRLTFEGTYNARPSVAADGRRVVMMHGSGRGYQIGILDRDTRQVRVLSRGRNDESPSFAPNGSMIIYATTEGGRGILAAVSDDGRVHQQLVLAEGEVREPAWSPFLD